DRIIICPRADVWTERRPLALAHTNEGAVVAGRRRSLAAGINGRERIGGIDIAQAVTQDISRIEQIKSRQPGCAAVNRILDCANAVLVLDIAVVKREIDIGLPTQVVAPREQVLHLVPETI